MCRKDNHEDSRRFVVMAEKLKRRRVIAVPLLLSGIYCDGSRHPAAGASRLGDPSVVWRTLVTFVGATVIYVKEMPLLDYTSAIIRNPLL